MDFRLSLAQFIGNSIRDRRLFIRMSQDILADEIGLTRTSVSNIEAGRQLPPLDILYKICHTLGIELPDLLPKYPNVYEMMKDRESAVDKLKTNNLTDSSIKRIENLIFKSKNQPK